MIEIELSSYGATSGSTFQSALDAVRDAGGGTVYVPEAYPIDRVLTVASHTIITSDAVEPAALEVTAPISRAFMLDENAAGVTFRNIEIDCAASVATAAIETQDGWSGLVVDAVRFLNGQATKGAVDSVRLNRGGHLEMTDTYHQRQFRALHIRGAVNDVTMARGEVKEVHRISGGLRVASSCQLGLPA